MFLLWLKLSATHILLPQQPNLNVIERKFKRQILMPDPIILACDPLLVPAPLFGTHPSGLPIYKCCTILESWDQEHSISEEKMGYTGGKKMTYGAFTIRAP